MWRSQGEGGRGAASGGGSGHAHPPNRPAVTSGLRAEAGGCVPKWRVGGPGGGWVGDAPRAVGAVSGAWRARFFRRGGGSWVGGPAILAAAAARRIRRGRRLIGSAPVGSRSWARGAGLTEEIVCLRADQIHYTFGSAPPRRTDRRGPGAARVS